MNYSTVFHVFKIYWDDMPEAEGQLFPIITHTLSSTARATNYLVLGEGIEMPAPSRGNSCQGPEGLLRRQAWCAQPMEGLIHEALQVVEEQADWARWRGRVTLRDLGRVASWATWDVLFRFEKGTYPGKEALRRAFRNLVQMLRGRVNRSVRNRKWSRVLVHMFKRKRKALKELSEEAIQRLRQKSIRRFGICCSIDWALRSNGILSAEELAEWWRMRVCVGTRSKRAKELFHRVQ